MPATVTLEGDWLCNLGCRYCNQNHADGRTLSASVFEEIIARKDEICGLRLFGGEPFDSPQSLAFLREYAEKKLPFTLYLSTNGQYGDLDFVKRLRCYRVQVSVSAASSECYRHWQHGEIERPLRFLRSLTESRAKYGYPVCISTNFVLLNGNISELPEAIRRDAEWGIQSNVSRGRVRRGWDIFYDPPEGPNRKQKIAFLWSALRQASGDMARGSISAILSALLQLDADVTHNNIGAV
ncbi:MAG: radical SAM protein [Planctomycetota bacterium]